MNFEAELAICDAATEGPWRAGRSDTVSYHGNGEGPYKNVYVDDPNGRWHMGERLPATICEAFEALSVDCRDNAKFIAHARTGYPEALRRLMRLRELMDGFIQQYPLPKIDDEIRELLELPQ